MMEDWARLPEILLLHIYTCLPLHDRLNASLTCKNWRNSLFHPKLWPEINLRFISGQYDRSKFLSCKVGYFVRTCSVEYDSESASDVEYLLKLLSRNSLLESLTLIPRSVWCSPSLSFGYMEWSDSCHETTQGSEFEHDIGLNQHQIDRQTQLYERPWNYNQESNLNNSAFRMLELVKLICTHSCQLKHLSLGCLPELMTDSSNIVKLLSQWQYASIKSLHINSVQNDLLYFPIQPLDMLCLRRLQHLGINMENLSDTLLIGITENGRAKLQTLTINVLTHHEGQKPIRNRTWDLVRQSCPNLKVTLNVIECVEAMSDLLNIIHPSMQLVAFRSFFCDDVNVPGFHYLAKHHGDTLESLQIIESLKEDGPLFYDIGPNEQDPFVMMAWKCKKLRVFSVLGVALCEQDVLAIARLRGKKLECYEIADDCIVPFSDEGEFEEDYNLTYQQFCDEISSSLGHSWAPIAYDDLSPAITEDIDDQSSAYLPILLSDQVPQQD